jgi:hypothetical protein
VKALICDQLKGETLNPVAALERLRGSPWPRNGYKRGFKFISAEMGGKLSEKMGAESTITMMDCRSTRLELGVV